MPRRIQRTFQRSVSRPNRSWFSVVSAAPVLVNAATKILLSTVVLSNQGIDETILRTVGGIAIFTDTPGASEEQIGSFGIHVVTDLAAAAGAASIPGPVTEGGDDGWQTYVPFAQSWNFQSAVGAQERAKWYPFDSKAKRVVSTGESLAIMIENAHAAQAFFVVLNMRGLSQVRGTR